MTDQSCRRWDLILKTVAVLGSVWAIYSYFDKKEMEFRKPIWDEQLRLYFDATDTTAKVANLPDGEDRNKAIERFWELYYGSLRVIEDTDNVSNAMERFGTCLRDKCNQTTLQNMSLALADACTLSLAETWSQKFKDYKALVNQRNRIKGG